MYQTDPEEFANLVGELFNCDINSHPKIYYNLKTSNIFHGDETYHHISENNVHVRFSNYLMRCRDYLSRHARVMLSYRHIRINLFYLSLLALYDFVSDLCACEDFVFNLTQDDLFKDTMKYIYSKCVAVLSNTFRGDDIYSQIKLDVYTSFVDALN